MLTPKSRKEPSSPFRGTEGIALVESGTQSLSKLCSNIVKKMWQTRRNNPCLVSCLLCMIACNMVDSATIVNILPDPPALSIDGIDALYEHLTLDVAYDASSSSVASAASCDVHRVVSDDCDDADTGTGNSISVTKVVSSANVDLDLDITLSSAFADSDIYSTVGNVGTLLFCSRCSYVSGSSLAVVASNIEIILDITNSSAPSISSSSILRHTTGSRIAETDNNVNAAYSVSAYKCSTSDLTSIDTSTTRQGEILNICIKIPADDVTCDFIESMDLDSTASGTSSITLISSGAISDSDLTEGNDESNSNPTEGICLVSTLFPGSFVPPGGGSGSLSATGSLVYRFKEDNNLDGRFLRMRDTRLARSESEESLPRLNFDIVLPYGPTQMRNEEVFAAVNPALLSSEPGSSSGAYKRATTISLLTAFGMAMSSVLRIQ